MMMMIENKAQNILQGVSKKFISFEVYKVFQKKNYIHIYPTPSARAGYDTRSIFKRSLTGLN